MKKKYLFLLIGVLFVVAFVVCAMKISNDLTDNGITLTKENKELVRLIYDNRKSYEKNLNGILCKYCVLQEINGELIFISVYEDNSSNEYKLNNDDFVPIYHSPDDISYMFSRTYYPPDDTGTMRGIDDCYTSTRLRSPEYDCYASNKEKYRYVEKMIERYQRFQESQEMRENG